MGAGDASPPPPPQSGSAESQSLDSRDHLSSGSAFRAPSLCSLQGPCLFIPNTEVGGWAPGAGLSVYSENRGRSRGRKPSPRQTAFVHKHNPPHSPGGRGGTKKPTPLEPHSFYCPGPVPPRHTPLLPTGALSLPKLFPQQAGLCSVNSSPLARQPQQRDRCLGITAPVCWGQRRGG